MTPFKMQIKKGRGDKILSDLSKALAKKEILIGVPEELNKRSGDTGVINNAYLVMLHTKGSPLTGLPSRPIIQPALELSENQEKIASGLGEIAEALLANNSDKAELLMETVGQDAENMVKDWFYDPRNGWPPVTDSTRWRKIKKTGLPLKERREIMIAGEGSTTLIDTAEMRNSITHVIREKR